MKAPEIEKLSLEDLKDKLADYQKQLLDLKMNHAVTPLDKRRRLMEQ
jgi:ribosomal protein L29